MALGFEGYSYTTTLGRKRVVLLHNEASSLNSNSAVNPLKRMCSGKFTFDSERSRLEALPLDVLVSMPISSLIFLTCPNFVMSILKFMYFCFFFNQL